MGYEVYLDKTQRGDEFAHDAPWAFVYDTDGVEDGYLNHAYNWVIDAFDYAYDSGEISGFTVEKRAIRNWTPDCNKAESGDYPIVGQWHDERNDNNLIHRGTHALIHSCSTDGEIALGTNHGENMWKTDNCAVAATKQGDQSLDNVADTVIHEIGHSASRRNLCYYVDEMAEESDHDLGIVRDVNGDDCETPLSVGGDDASRGSCDTDSGWFVDGETYRYSDCEKDALELTADHTDGYHDP